MDKLGRYRLIPDRRTGEDYMHRYYLFLKDRKFFPFNITLHKIVKSDDPIFHDHPWPFITIILSGGYWEHTPVYNNKGEIFAEFTTWRGPGSILKRSAKEFHWLEIDETIKKHQWIQWENYLENYKEYHQRYIEPKIKSMNRKKQ